MTQEQYAQEVAEYAARRTWRAWLNKAVEAAWQADQPRQRAEARRIATEVSK
jgi:hypothetical protein